MTPTLETERLLLRPLALEDVEQMQLLFPHWQIVKCLNARVPWPYPPDGVQIIGDISLVRGDKINRGFWLASAWQNRGLMTEAVIAVNDFWFDTLGFPRLRVSKAAGNIASRRISEKTGMRVVATEERDFVSGRLPSEIWEITADEWHEFRSRLTSHHASSTQAKKRRLS